ncbi:MAG: TolC family protein [bacterium]
MNRYSVIPDTHVTTARNVGFPGIAFALALGLCLTGCASSSENALRGQYRETGNTIYGRPGATNELSRLDGNSTLEDYLRYAFANSLVMRAAYERWEAAIERIPQARALDNPALSFEYFIEQRDLRYQVSLSQMLPGFGKLGLRDRRAAAEAEAASHEFEARRVMVYDRVVKAFYEYHYLSRAIGVADENLQLLSNLEEVVATRYKTGSAAFSELIKVQLEKDRLANELVTMRDERGSKSATLAALLNLAGRDVLAWPKVIPSGATAIDEAVLAGMIEDLNPELKAAVSMIAAEEFKEKLAQRSFLPDFTIGANWMVMPGIDGKGDESDASLMAGITLPIWWDRYRAEIREARAMARAATSERDDRRNMLKADLRMAIFKFRDAERRIALFATSLIPKATQALEVAKQEFSSGKTDFMTLVDAQRALLEFKLLSERAVVDREIANAEIGCCIGKYGDGLGAHGELPIGKK